MQHYPGHYSGANPVPTISKFIQSLDKDKAERDKRLDEQSKAQKSQLAASNQNVQDHKPQAMAAKGSQKEVTDPTTGRQVVIEDVNKDVVDLVDNPILSVPNANLGKDTPMKTEASQKNPEYGRIQDETAPPDPVAPGTTSDVPIHGEKSNILFHPTPSVSYEPTFKSLEQRATGLCIGVFVGIVFVGRVFGGKYIGLIPLAMCVTSGIWLWAKEVVRSGREVEWESEKTRGETVSFFLQTNWAGPS
jgi:Ca2+-dependent lipid-binding protein